MFLSLPRTIQNDPAWSRKVTVATAFVAAQALDMLTTAVGLSLGLWETNPLATNMGTMYLVKTILATCVAIVLLLKRQTWLNWIVVTVAALPVAWNILVITLELLL